MLITLDFWKQTTSKFSGDRTGLIDKVDWVNVWYVIGHMKIPWGGPSSARRQLSRWWQEHRRSPERTVENRRSLLIWGLGTYIMIKATSSTTFNVQISIVFYDERSHWIESYLKLRKLNLDRVIFKVSWNWLNRIIIKIRGRYACTL